jgi:hypothetical protein
MATITKDTPSPEAHPSGLEFGRVSDQDPPVRAGGKRMSVKKKAMIRVKKLDRSSLQRLLARRLDDRRTYGCSDADLRDRLVAAVVKGDLQLHELAVLE